MQLENRYVVIKREYLTNQTFDEANIEATITAGHFEELANHLMSLIGNDYFVLNLDEPISELLVRLYFEVKNHPGSAKVVEALVEYLEVC